MMIRTILFSLVIVSLGCLTLNSPVLAESPIAADEGLVELDWMQAREAIGKEARISGKIINVGRAGKINFLNFDTQRPPAFVGVIYQDALDNFPKPLKDTYLNQLVRIRGRVTTYRDKPQIVITNPDQIEILEALPESLLSDKPKRLLKTEGQITVATYNVLNLFDDKDDPYHADEGTSAKPREQLERLAKSIIDLDADVIAMEEVENRGYLQRFVDVFLAELGYEHVVLYEGNDLRGIDVCVLSRLPVGPVRSYRHLRFTDADGNTRTFNRDVIAVTIEPPGAEPLEIWPLHLKSNSGGREFAEPIRLAEANQIRKLLDDQLTKNADARILVVGDFNDVWQSETLQTIVGGGPNALWSVASDLSGDMPDTYNKGEHHSMIDFILCSPAMAKLYVPDSCHVVPGSIETTGSDHNPVTASFRLK